MFVLDSDITIGGFRFGGVNEVVISRSLHSITHKAVIKIPALARISRKGTTKPENVVTGTQFSDGDAVEIRLGYNGRLQTEFKGFVVNRALNRPLEITCEGYSSLLAAAKVNVSKSSVKIIDLLQDAVKGLAGNYPITIACDVDMTLQNVRVQGSGLDILKAISRYTDGCVTCWFPEPDVLWCGLPYTPYSKGADMFRKGTVNYKLGYNVLHNNKLTPKILDKIPAGVQYSKRVSGGSRLTAISNVFKNSAITHSRPLTQLQTQKALQQLANEKALKLGYVGYEGTLVSFLEPFVSPGCTAQITDPDYPDRDGGYLVESVVTQFGIHGARRKVEIGPRFGFLNEMK